MNKLELTRGQLTAILQAATGNVKDFVMDNDKFIDEQLKAINYTRCSAELSGEISEDQKKGYRDGYRDGYQEGNSDVA